jgi:hypothetical protein
MSILRAACWFPYATLELGAELVPFPHFAPHQPHIFHGAGQAMREDSITRIQERGQHQAFPLDVVLAPPDAAGVGFAFHRIELAPAFESHPVGAPYEQSVGGAVGAAGQFLDGEAV